MSQSLKSYEQILSSEEYIVRHKKRAQDFTRERKLPFLTVLTILTRKSVKSLQAVLNEWCCGLDMRISASALSQARQKFYHTAFVELLEKCVVDVMYNDGDYRTYKGHRLLSIDGSTLRLPTGKELIQEFGVIKYMNGKQKEGSNNVESKISVLYDVLNEIPVSGSLHRARTNDIKASEEHTKLLRKGDILIADRGYGSYGFFANILDQNADFLVRLKDKTYNKYHHLFDDNTIKEYTTSIPRSKHFCSVAGIQEEIKIRFIRVDLPGGETEILATSLIDKKKYPYKDFRKLYHKRWKIETYFHTLKSRLSIDNFTGKSVEAVRQDFFATLFVSGLETIITEEAQDELAARNTKHPQKVNKAISFHAIKNEIILMMADPPENFEEHVKSLFLHTPTLVRTHREKDKERKALKTNDRSLAFQKHARKQVF